jgi:hypothetical protein
MEYGGSMADFKNPYEFDMALLEPVWYMMRRGVKIDKKKKLEFSGEYKSRWDKFQKDLNYVAGYERRRVRTQREQLQAGEAIPV